MPISETAPIEGSFGSFRTDPLDVRRGTKSFLLDDKALQEEGVLSHCWSEVSVLGYLSRRTDSRIAAFLPLLLGTSIKFGTTENKTELLLHLQIIQGPSLLDRLNSGPAISPAEALKWSCELITALSLLHSKYGISHGDLKLDNILLKEPDKPGTSLASLRLIDFGAAR